MTMLVRGVYGLKLAQGSFSFYAWAIISLRVEAEPSCLGEKDS